MSDWQSAGNGLFRIEVPGGHLYSQPGNPNMTFVPVTKPEVVSPTETERLAGVYHTYSRLADAGVPKIHIDTKDLKLFLNLAESVFATQMVLFDEKSNQENFKNAWKRVLDDLKNLDMFAGFKNE